MVDYICIKSKGIKSFFFIMIVLFSLNDVEKCHAENSSPKIHVIGDSHSLVFKTIPGCIINYIGPVTMHRIGRDGLDILNFKSFGIKEDDAVVLVFGEIDVRCHIGKQRDIKDRNVNEVIDTLLQNYFQTILLNKSLYDHLVVFTYTVPPPTNRAYNHLYPYYGTLKDRINISKLLNDKLIETSNQLGINVLNVFDFYADENGCLNESYSDGNCHINPLCNQPIQDLLFSMF